MQPTETTGNLFYRFFSLSDRNKILALIIVFMGFSVYIGSEIAKYSLTIIKDGNMMLKEDNTRLRLENKELKNENQELLIFKRDHLGADISKLDTINHDLNIIKEKLNIK